MVVSRIWCKEGSHADGCQNLNRFSDDLELVPFDFTLLYGRETPTIFQFLVSQLSFPFIHTPCLPPVTPDIRNQAQTEILHR